tara:strand:+ start:605 stop:1372 length:768 start_codon:yes stop_codon:yes gene_type:complete
MRYKKNIFDVGAFNGVNGLALAVKNPDTLINAFEANKSLIKTINELKKKIELRIGRKLNNYKIHNVAVSNKSNLSYFYIAKNPTVSSLHKFSKNIDKTWPGYRKTHCHTIKKVKIKTITLKKFCNDNKIEIINYLHVDTQGSDLNVLKGLGNLIGIVKQGVIESSISEKNSLYQNNHTLKQVKKFFKKINFSIKKIDPIESSVGNEVDIYYQNKKFKDFEDLKTKYNERYYHRVLDNRLSLKDNMADFFLRIFGY